MSGAGTAVGVHEAEEPGAHWDARYAEHDRVWSDQPNAALVDEVAELPPGTALDLGAGEGADAAWLAERGWRVTAVDVSTVAVARGRARAPQVEWVVADLATWVPPRRYDLVTACFLHSFGTDFPREAILRRAAASVAPGGSLLVVAHATIPPWSAHRHDGAGHGPAGDGPAGHEFPGHEAELAALALDASWIVRTCQVRPRRVTGPDGRRAIVEDSVVLVARRPGS